MHIRGSQLKILFLVLLVLGCAVVPALAVQDDPERTRGFQLFEDSKYVEALPVFEKLAAKYPQDREVIKRYGLLVMSQAAYLKDAAARKEARRRGREVLVKALELGVSDALVKSMVEGVPADGGDDTRLSSKKEAEEAMREAKL